MKKLVSLLLVFVMLLGVLCSCNDTNKNTNIPSDDANAPSTKPQAEIAMEMYEAAIKDEICVFDKDSGEIKLKECRFPTDNTTLGECEILYKAILDLDGDGINEYVIQSEAKDHIVLRYYDGLVYSYCFGSMDLYNLNINGSFYWIDSYELTNCTRGYNKIAFDGSSLSIKEIYKIKQTRAEDYGDGTHEYYVGGKQITREEFLDYYSYSEKRLAIFSPLDISCEYPISSEKAFELASNYWGFKSGMEEGAAGTYYILKIVILEKPNGDTQSYRIGKQAEGYTTHAIDSSSAQPPQSVSIYEELFVDAITGECFEESKPNEEDEPSDEVNKPDDEGNKSDEEGEPFDIPDLSQSELTQQVDLTNASIVWSGEKEEYYIYLKEWGVYRLLSGAKSYHTWHNYVTDNCITVDNETATIALIDQFGKQDEPTILTYRFNKSNGLVELHAVQLNIIASSEYDTFFVNMHSADRGYYFLTPRADGESDWRINEFPGWEVDERPTWPLLVFETTDGGKSWNQISTNTFDYTSDVINIFKFVSPQVGVISFRDFGGEDFYKRSYLTVDGGLTWCQMPKLPYLEWYSEIINFEYDEDCDCYRLTVDGYDNYIKCQFQFWSTDLENWILVDDATSTISCEEAKELAIEYFYECYKVKPGDVDSRTGYRYGVADKSTNDSYYTFALAWLVEGTHYSTLELINVDAITGEITPYDYNNNSSVG